MKTYILTFLLIIVFSLFIHTTSFQIKGTMLLNSTNFDQALQKFKNLVVYFSSKTCGYCGQMDLAYAVLQQKYRNISLSQPVNFAKIFFQQAQSVFKKYSIKAVPTLKMFKNKQIIDQQLDSVDYDQQSILYGIKWINRLVQGKLPEWQQRNKQEDLNVNVLISCDCPAIKQIQKISVSDIYSDYFCTKNKSLIFNNNSVLIGKSTQNQKIYVLPQNQKIKQFLKEKINYHKKVIKWGNYAIRQLFTHQESMILVLLNKQHRSDSMLRVLNRIRQQRDDIPYLFVSAQLQDDIQNIAKLKQYIGVVNHYVYPFPLLLFITHKNGRLAKYSFGQILEQDINFQKLSDGQYFNQTQINKWIDKAINGKDEQHFRSYDLSPLDRFYQQPNKKIVRIHLPDFKFLLTYQYQQQFLVFVEWKNDHLSNYVEDSIIKKWYLSQQSEHINMYLFSLNQNDLPPKFQTLVTRVPSLIYIDKNKNGKVLSTISSYDKDVLPWLKQVVSKYLGPRSKKQPKSEQRNEDQQHNQQSFDTSILKVKQSNSQQQHLVQKN